MGQILGLLSKDFIMMIILALIIATPITAYLMNNWLDNYVFRINMPWGIFLLTGVIAVMVALATVSIQGIRAATTNPIDSLRDE